MIFFFNTHSHSHLTSIFVHRCTTLLLNNWIETVYVYCKHPCKYLWWNWITEKYNEISWHHSINQGHEINNSKYNEHPLYFFIFFPPYSNNKKIFTRPFWFPMTLYFSFYVYGEIDDVFNTKIFSEYNILSYMRILGLKIVLFFKWINVNF